MARERVLVFAPGTMPREASYFLPESPGVLETTNLAPIALVKLAKNVHGKEYPDRVVALCTKRAIDETLETIESGFSELDIAVEPHKVPDGKDENELKEIVRILLQAIPDECDLTLDITHGFRSSPFVFSVAAQYLSFLRPSVTIEGLYYGMLRNTPPDSPDAAPLAPLVDMSVLLELMDWVYAARVLARSAAALSALPSQWVSQALTIPFTEEPGKYGTPSVRCQMNPASSGCEPPRPDTNRHAVLARTTLPPSSHRSPCLRSR
jgi:CRISPR-associated DxTHG motif protein